MNKVIISHHVTKLLRTHGSRVWMSSLVEIGVPGQYPLPLVSLPITTLHLKCDTFQVPRMQPSGLYPVTSMQMIPFPACHENTVLIKPSALSSKDHLPPSILLQSDVSEQTPGPPKPEKPKWEEEQYPDIGKTIDIISNHLPFLLIQPLPKSILSSKVELRLFPTTHPFLPTLRLSKFFYRTFFRAVRWLAPVVLNRSLRSFGSPSGVKGIGLEITCLRVIKIDEGRRIEARWRTSSSPWSPKSEVSEPTNKVEEMPRTWSGWFYFDINRKGLIVRHVIENISNQRKMESEIKLKDILVGTVSNGRALGQGFGSVEVERGSEIEREDVPKLQWRIIPRIFPSPSPSNIFVSARTYC